MNYFENEEAYYSKLDEILPDKYVQQRDLSEGKKHFYYPTAIQEAVADCIFQYWHVIDEDYSVIANELICTVKLVYMPAYEGASEHICTGSASIPIQMVSGSKPIDFPAKKISNAISYNLPAVRAMAIGCSLETLGNVFGRNLSRRLNKDTLLPRDFTLRTKPQQIKKEVKNG